MEQKKALLIRLSSLGDVIFNIPLANILKSNGYKVTWIVGEKGFEVIKNNPAVDEMIFIPWKKWEKQCWIISFFEYLKLIKHIRSQNFDVAIDSQGLWKSFIWMYPCGAKRKIVPDSGKELSRFGGKEKIRNLHSPNIHAVYNYLKFAKHLGFDCSKVNITLPIANKDCITKIDNIMKDINTSKPIIAIAPATTWASKHWNKDNWKQLVKRLEKDYTIILTGTTSEQNLIKYISENKHYDISGKTNIIELAELFRRCDLVITVDSGSAHLAWATQTPKIITIFCSTPPVRYAPIGSKEKYIALSANISCQYCHTKDCNNIKKDYKCTFLPSVEEVENSVKKLFANNIII